MEIIQILVPMKMTRHDFHESGGDKESRGQGIIIDEWHS
jgi:hypothetical protein